MGLSRADRDLVGLTVLALLLTGPQHTYEMQRLMKVTHKDFVTGLPRSMYHAVDRLLSAGLIEVAGTAREGSRPERTLYRLTGAGRDELTRRTARLLAVPDPDGTPFVAALSFMAALSPRAAAAALRERAAVLRERIAGHDRALDGQAHLPRVLMIEAEYERARLRAELDWVSELVGELDAGRLDWPDDPAAWPSPPPGP